MLTKKHVILERPHPHGIGGVQIIYRLGGGYGLSAVNSPAVHSYPFAWEFAVLEGVEPDGKFKGITYKTPLTDDVVVVSSDEEANTFIEGAIAYFGEPTP